MEKKKETIDLAVKALGTLENALRMLVSFHEDVGKLLKALSADNEREEQATSQDRPPEEEKKYTFPEVRAILAGKSGEGYTAQVKQLISKYSKDGGKLSDVKPENYNALMRDAQFVCREPFSREEVKAQLDELLEKGYQTEASAILEHHMAKSADDLKEEYFASFMRDAWEVGHAR